MEISINGGLRVKINKKNKTASIIESPESTGTILIPRFVEYENDKYKIISIGVNSFWNAEIESVIFPEDSEVETFENQCFGNSKIKKLQIPPKLKNLQPGWHNYIENNIEFTISSKNKNFSYYHNKYLLGKSEENSNEFDALYCLHDDIEEVVIPSRVKILKNGLFHRFKKLTTITFSQNSKLKVMEGDLFTNSNVRKLVLPSSIEHIDDDCFSSVCHLTEIDILPGNKKFTVIENKYLLKKSEVNSKNYDVLLFARRDIENVVIPSYIKVINNDAFGNCKQLKSFTFEPNSSLELLKIFAFIHSTVPEKIVFPPSFNEACSYSFYYCKSVKYIEFLCKSIKICLSSFSGCSNLLSVSFPNANNILLGNSSICDISKETKFFVRHDVNISGVDVEKFQKMIAFIEDGKNSNKKEKPKSSEKTKKVECEVSNKEENLEKQIEKMKKERSDLERYVSYLQDRLKNFEEVPSVEEFLTKEKKYKNNKKEKRQTKTLINEKDEKYHKIESKIGEGASSEVYKVKDTRTGQVFCKKVIKETREEELFKTLKNSVKEIEVSLQIQHPCICECLGYNLEEEMKKEASEDDDDNDDEYEESYKEKKTTIAIFIEYLPFSVKSLIDNKMISNTLKARIAVEVAFGMKHIHSLGMMHRDLKLENIMMNSVFHSKIIDFGLAHAGNLNDTMSSLTKGIGTFSYMSPEMINEEDYNNKTDVFSYGILLFVLFTGRLPKQTMRERLDKVPLKFPKVSSKISEYCIDLIKRCTSFRAAKRPSFEEIINDMEVNSFDLASEIDTKIILQRYQELNRFESIK